MMMRPTIRRAAQRGFSLIELLVVLFILTLVMGVVFGEINLLQMRFRTEETKLDLSQEAREAMDAMVRDLYTAGFPNTAMFSPGVLSEPPLSDSRVAAGLVSVSPTEVWFEGDLEGDGVIRSVRYSIAPAADGTCPCLLRRSEVTKVNATAPWAQPSNFATLLGTVVNSGGARNIGGNSILPDGTAVANNTLFAVYRDAPVFAAFDAAGNEVALPLDIQTDAGQQAIRSIRTIRITLNVLAERPDMQTNLRPVMSLTSHARVRN